MRKNVESRLEKLEEGGSHRVEVILMKPGETEDQALRRIKMQEEGIGQPPPKGLVRMFIDERDAKI